ncbi:SDR family NAD(P)-dependent oxidoreductase [Flavobacterium aquicola]|uniref:NADP-dependent 3-hydroxy acid dehydrogenase YdfG n=1 Tax=Flavobacterium aquicola TaxID=1682742 RepID=A0A3E0EU10_9FLAO|nr:SDR family NAD(P)-dependent oxidoreductase [Flavobacterium aquicola]REH01646.1 NADP-dependent 3-hydroxy acid dehydrogenase YdfG [Flavobacterium aquicola]
MTKIALITGATSGIGKATAIKLAENGYDLIICGRRAEKLEELKSTLAENIKTYSLIFDVRDRKEVELQLNSLPNDWKNIDVLVNSAGNAHGLSTIDNGDIEDWDAMIDGNVKGLLYVSKAVIPQMVERKKGHIINLSSVAGKQTYANGAVYCASKKAVEAISEGMRLDLTQHGIKITNIAPGAVATEFSEVRFKGDTERAQKVYEGYDPLLAEDIAHFIAYAVNAPDRVTIADVTIYAKSQSAPTMIYKK